MNWKDIKKNYPKAFDKAVNHLILLDINKYNYITWNEDLECFYLENEASYYEGYLELDITRFLYDFFDSVEIMVSCSVTRWSTYTMQEEALKPEFKFGKTYGFSYDGVIYIRADERNAMDITYINSNHIQSLPEIPTRKEWEIAAFTKAFEILNNKL